MTCKKHLFMRKGTELLKVSSGKYLFPAPIEVPIS